jgi:hypothetical protein
MWYYLIGLNKEEGMKVRNHPELREGEVLLGNFDSSGYQDISRWKTKRKGVTPYDIDGKQVYVDPDSELFPVFVKRQELEKAGIPLEE